MSDRLELFRADIGRSAESLEDVLRAHTELAAGDLARPVRFVGLGSSRFAALTVAAALTDRGVVARVEVASSRPSPALPGERVFAVSASGRTPEVVEAARRLSADATVVAVTNDTSSELAKVSPACLALGAGGERAGIACLTYRATLAVLSLATGAATQEELGGAVDAVRGAVPSGEAAVEEAAALLDGADAIDLVAGSTALGTAEQAALMLREAPRLRATAWAAPEWPHTAIYTALPGHRLVIVGSTPAADEIERTVRGRGGAAVRLGTTRRSPDVAAALVDSVLFELLAAALWRRAGGQTQGPLHGVNRVA